MSVSDIVSTKVEARYFERWSTGYWSSGLALTMKDGSEWFHPYTGKNPIKLKEKRENSYVQFYCR